MFRSTSRLFGIEEERITRCLFLVIYHVVLDYLSEIKHLYSIYYICTVAVLCCELTFVPL